MQTAWGQPVETIQVTDQLHAQIRHFTYAYGFPVEDVRSVTGGPEGRLWLIASKADGLGSCCVFLYGLISVQLLHYKGAEYQN